MHKDKENNFEKSLLIYSILFCFIGGIITLIWFLMYDNGHNHHIERERKDNARSTALIVVGLVFGSLGILTGVYSSHVLYNVEKYSLKKFKGFHSDTMNEKHHKRHHHHEKTIF